MEEQKLLQILKCILNGQQTCDCHMTPAEWVSVSRLAAQHKLLHLMGFAMKLFPAES